MSECHNAYTCTYSAKEMKKRRHVIICLYFVFSITVVTLLLIFLFLKCKLYANLLHCLTCTFISPHAKRKFSVAGGKKQQQTNKNAAMQLFELPPPSPPVLLFFSKSRNNKKEQLFKDEEVLAGSFFSPTRGL